MGKISSTAGNKIISKIITEVNVEMIYLTKEINISEELFTQVHPYYSEEKNNYPNKGIIQYASLTGLVDIINSITEKLKKDSAPALLKGLYKGGVSGKNCFKASPFLFYDIDVKDTKENPALVDKKKNSDVYDFLKEISVVIFRSNSGLGMAGVLYVPFLESLLEEGKELHKKIGDHVTFILSKEIEKATGIKVVFDGAQSKFRQIRFTAMQEFPIELNTSPKEFKVTLNKREEYTLSGIPKFSHTTTQAYVGDIYYKYNTTKKIEDELSECGFIEVSPSRWFHPTSTSNNSTGQVNLDTNTFYSHSSSFGIGLYTPSKLHRKCFNQSHKEFVKYSKACGYEEKPLDKSDIDKAIERLNNENLGSIDIFEICDPFKFIPIDKKLDLISRLSIDDLTLKHVHEYLMVKDLKIKYDAELEIQKYVGEVIEKVFCYADENKNICVYADTGTGKTTATLNYLKSNPSLKAIFLVPLQSIAYQIHCDHKIPYLIGDSSAAIHSLAKKSNVFVATNEQGVKHLLDHEFDYIIVDEGHDLIINNSYKTEVIRELGYMIKTSKSKVILLTGSPLNIFKQIGFSLLKIQNLNPYRTDVIERFTKLSGYQVIISHVTSNVGKMLIRYNHKDHLEEAKKYLCKNPGYNENEIVVIHSGNKNKESEYKLLLQNEKFSDHIKIVLITSLIDEGISINQEDFKSVVYIATGDRLLRPEAPKQFFARFRNHDPERLNYLYRNNANTSSTYFNEKAEFTYSNKMLDGEKNNYHQSYQDIFSVENFYLKDGTVNDFYLANYVTNKTFEGATSHEYDYYLKTNYSINIVRDNGFKEIKVDQSEMRLSLAEKKARIATICLEDFDTVLTILMTESKDPGIREDLKNSPVYINEENADFIAANLSSYETIYKYYVKFLKLEIDPFTIIFKNGKQQGNQAINNQLYLIETIHLVKNAKTQMEIAKKEKIERFTETLREKKEFTKKDIEEEYNKVSPIRECSLKAIELVLKNYMTLTYDKRNKIYKVKNG
ncbi:DEAD/DEAH box helicase family protein [Flavobacteriaceae bacterium]|nr:DEAD/DEAH box helicase family protein [Flavobacteriaceae bacterium]MDB9903343.1 DEAD/DEAH box helicase family protein [Flavobacteriaceae bacterium]